jgi:hypothetical protein
MALISCKECGNQVSTLASACPKCGAPIAAAAVKTPVQTTELTSKDLKFKGCLARIALVIGAFIAWQGFSNGSQFLGWIGMLVVTFGAVLWLATRFSIWWHHE